MTKHDYRKRNTLYLSANNKNVVEKKKGGGDSEEEKKSEQPDISKERNSIQRVECIFPWFTACLTIQYLG
jgi:hypothetical protein